MEMIDLFSFITIRAFMVALNLLPVSVRLSVVYALTRLFFILVPHHRAIAVRNMQQVFPESTPEDRKKLFRKFCWNVARFIVDSARLHLLDEKWVKEHVKIDSNFSLEDLNSFTNGKPVMFATGHFGSFELLAHAFAIYDYPVHYIARELRIERAFQWLKTQREKYGNKIILRTGATRQVIDSLKSGYNAGMLIDQNVKKDHAVFVDFFGRQAATTRGFGFIAVETEIPVVAVTILNTGDDRYQIKMTPCDCSDIYQDNSLDNSTKVLEVTKRVTKVIEELILEAPHNWFWIHRRWKTAPEGTLENFYSIKKKDNTSHEQSRKVA